MRSIVSTASGGRPVLARGECGSTICTSTTQGTTRSISSKNLALRVFLVEMFRPGPGCFVTVLWVAVMPSSRASHGPVLQSFLNRGRCGALGGQQGRQRRQRAGRAINRLYKAEFIHRRALWKTKEAVELTAAEWVAWFNNHRLLEPIGCIPPAEAGTNHQRKVASQANAVAA